MQFLIAFRVLAKRIKAIRFMLKDKKVPRRKKALVIAGICYLVLPVDLIPPILFPVGFLDDLILWIWILWHLRDTLDQYWMGGPAAEDLSRRYKGKDIIEDAAFEVEDGPETRKEEKQEE